MKQNQLFKYSLLVIFLFVGLLFSDIICYAATDSNNIPSCTYSFSGDIGGKSASYTVEVGYYQNTLGFYNTKKKKYTESIQLDSSYTAQLNDEARGALKADNKSFSCPTNLNISLVDSLGASRKITFGLTKDNSIVQAVEEGENTNGNKLEECSSNHIQKMKEELDSVFTQYLNNLIYPKLQEITNLDSTYRNNRGEVVNTDISYIETLVSETASYYKNLMNGTYGTKKNEVIEKYRKSCVFNDNNEALTYIKNRESQLEASIKNIGENKKNQAETWMKEKGTDAETIREQKELYDKNVAKKLEEANEAKEKNNSSVSNLIDDIKDSQEIPEDCGIFSDIMPYLELVFKWIRILVPIALIIFGVMDFTMPIISNDKDALNKATAKFIKRCIIAIIIFFVPTIVEILLKVYNESTGANASTCGLGKIITTYFWR